MQSLEGQSFGDYEIQAKLGQGGMGAVYRAQQTLLKRTVALKVMAPQLAEDPAYAARFVREAAAAANLNHPNMVLVYTAGKIDGTHYIAMEFVDGESLRKRLDREGRLDPREAVAITVYITQALQYAWNKARLIHRDIKPDNIFLSSAGEVKVGDLGLAKSVGSASTDLTASGMAMGSPHYISPEQARGLKDIDFRADIYSLGCTLYHTLTGRTPYDGDDSMSIMMKHVNEPPPAIFRVWPQCPMPLGMLVGKMLAKDRNARPRSYEDLLADLLAVHEKLKHAESPAPVAAAPAPPATPTPAPAPKPKTRGAKPVTRDSRLVLGGVVAAAVVLIGGLLLWSPWKSGTDEQGRREDGKTGSESRLQAESVATQPAKAGTPNPASSAAALQLLGNVYTNAVGAEMVYIPPGEFLMGSTKEEQAWAIQSGSKEGYVKREGEQPCKAGVKNGFWLGRTEVTVGQWKQFVSATGYKTDAEKNGFVDFARQKGNALRRADGLSWRDPGFGEPPQENHAVCCISWNDAVAFCEWATERERKAGRLPAGYVMRLPTEAEWEYACRAGTQTKFWWGESQEDGEGRFNWVSKDDGFEFVAPVDSYGARGRNGFGLADMLGNVGERCLDDFDETRAHEECYKGSPGVQVFRGGDFSGGIASYRCAARNGRHGAYSDNGTGFRVCVGPDVFGATTAKPSTFQPAAALKEAGILAPAETRVTALTANPKVGEVCTLDMTGGITMELMGIPPGEFMMGSTKEEQEWALANGAKEEYVKIEGEQPRKTAIKQGFWIGRTEVTVGQWKQFVAATGYVTTGEKKGESHVPQASKAVGLQLMKDKNWRDPNFGFEPRNEHPVCCVSWNDAKAFCDWTTEQERKTGRLPAGYEVRLPTEAEWEYACRAGAQTKFWWGESLEDSKGRWNLSGNGDGYEFVAPVDSYGARGRNRFGLADMLGNVYEWCLDEYGPTQAHEECYRGNSGVRVLRGGAFHVHSGTSHARCAFRSSRSPLYSISNVGFRLLIGPTVGAAASPTAAPKEGGILAPAETRVAALTANPKVGEVATLDLGGSVTMEMMGIPLGEFMMGSTKEEREWATANGNTEDRLKCEGDQPRRTTIKQGFWLGRTEVTVGQWKQFVAATGYVTDGEKKGESHGPVPGASSWGAVKDANWKDPKLGYTLQDNLAVRCISWDDAVAFCEWLNEREQKAGRLSQGFKVRLPVEAEWEYACRAGVQTKFWWGDSVEDGDKRLNWQAAKRGFNSAAQEVDSYGARGRNKFGLADMLGNVKEWCLDHFDPTGAHEELYVGDPSKRVVRGGSSYNSRTAGNIRCAGRGSAQAATSHCDYGFRVCVGPDVLGSAATPAASATRPSSPVTSAGADVAWVKSVAALPAKEQLQCVVAKLKELNPGFDGKETHRVEHGVVTNLDLNAEAIADISPVRALDGLQKFLCSGSRTRKSRLADISPLRGLKLVTLDLADTSVEDIGALEGMPLEFLRLTATKVGSVLALKGMPLRTLFIAGTSVRDLSPLRGLPLEDFQCDVKVEDLSPLKDLPLTRLSCGFVPERDTDILRSIKTLETINSLPAAEFWKKVDAGKALRAK